MCSTNWSNFDLLFSKLIVISNSQLTKSATVTLEELGIAEVIQRENLGFDFAAWRDGMAHVWIRTVSRFWFGYTHEWHLLWSSLGYVWPSWRLLNNDRVLTFGGWRTLERPNIFEEHLQSYFISFKNHVVASEVFQKFWTSIKTFTDVQDVIDNYETRVTSVLTGGRLSLWCCL